MHIIDGKTISTQLLEELKQHIAALGFSPGLGVVLVGSRDASLKYVAAKKRACDAVGITLHERHLAHDASTAEILSAVHALNTDPNIHGIIVQLPLPRVEDTADVLNAIVVDKDVDGMTVATRERLRDGDFGLLPVHCRVVERVLEEAHVAPKGMRMAMVVKSTEPYDAFASVFSARGATTLHVHPDAADLASQLASADVVFSLPGRPHLITQDMIKPGAVVIDFDYPVASVDFERIKNIASAITPVPGGCGPLTVAYLLQNVYEAARRVQPKS